MYLKLREASEFLGIAQKDLENYAKVGAELPITKEKRIFVIDRDDLERWKAEREYRLVTLNRNNYVQCFNFAIESFYTYKSRSDFLGSRERGLGKWCEDFIPGKLGEIAVARFIKKNFDIDIQLDFSIGEGIPAQDITTIALPRKGQRAFNPTRIRTSIKTTKMKNVWLAVPQKELDDPMRSSNVYILSRLELPLDHLGRIMKDHDLLRGALSRYIPDFQDVRAEVVGFANKEDLQQHLSPEEWKNFTSIPRPHYAMKTGELRKTERDWQEYLSRL